MSELKSLLIEIGTEELPPKALDDLAAAFVAGIVDGLTKRGISADTSNAKLFATPRRLAVLVPHVATEQPEQTSERRGPAMNAALDASGQPSKALIGFAQSCSVTVEQLQKLETDKGAWFVHRAVKPGQPTAALMQEIVIEALKALPIPKAMRWGDHDFSFVRPVHWLVILHGEQVIDAEIFGIKSDRFSRGHRFMAPEKFDVVSADLYQTKLLEKKVIANPIDRRNKVASVVEQTINALGLAFVEPVALTAEVSNLVEWPVAIHGTFDQAFLDVPSEALIATMQNNQKFFPVFDANNKLTEHFIGVANIESKDPAEIRKGYERVIRPRFADAKFFYDEDRKQPLEAQLEALKSVTYQQSLGSVWDKSMRVAELARVIANRVGVDAALATRAAALSKCDLMTRMVGEFPELQGVMGRYYASQGAKPEHADVAQALDEFYAPRFAGDNIAQGKLAQVIAVAERVDTLAGIFAVGQKPSGNKDPFALRRAALGLARTLIEAKLDLDLRGLLSEAFALLPEAALQAGLPRGKDGKTAILDAGARRTELAAEILDFILDRLRGYYADQGISGDVFEAVRAVEPATLSDFDQRMHAVVEFAKLPEAQALAAANKRIGNILRQADASEIGVIDSAQLEAGAEADLHTAVTAASSAIKPLLATRSYVDVLKHLADLRAPVDAFFEGVMVMVHDAAKRRNRLSLLAQLRRMFLEVADISLLHNVA
ncbi:glycine--tRNA ligase subunit beta [Pseudolysobacter antarcticus]|uniref:Glycine--tRNA ligase beta subunit n=1 Tax=Pseudolysobacter antarcticus TaxID=2511995 RepID=A0A411HEM6_9GAMM|nr:glycine--tRNA ligase subunit beta [Pseudolysobacter antarcticus]QBB68943.1 glycine--tRNA ligase subunit beta [Pseudolysobacter antarcticus]